MNGENISEDDQEQQQPLELPMEVADMIELTPEGIRDNLSHLQELMNNHQQEECLRDVRTRLDYGEGPSSTQPRRYEDRSSFHPGNWR
jgi:hypothetical protein